MRKIFTLMAAASVACAVNAQSVETFNCYNEDGTLKEIFVANPDAQQMTVIDISTASVKAEQTSGPVAGFIDGYDPENLEKNYDNGFSFQNGGTKNDPIVKQYPDTTKLSFNFVVGKGNPVNLDKVKAEEIIQEGEPTGKYRADWSESYYQPDGSAGMPLNGTYLKFTPSVAGEISALCWVNKGNRLTYVVKQSDMKAIPYGGTEVTVSGWDGGVKYDAPEGDPFSNFPMYQEKLQTKAQIAEAKGETPGENDAWVLGNGNQPVLAYITVKVVANETYWIFQQSSQIGLNSYTFTPEGGAGIAGIEADQNAPVEYFNLQGIRVNNPENGLYIRRQGNKVSKVIL